jgi:hypothetical protein
MKMPYGNMRNLDLESNYIGDKVTLGIPLTPSLNLPTRLKNTQEKNLNLQGLLWSRKTMHVTMTCDRAFGERDIQ